MSKSPDQHMSGYLYQTPVSPVSLLYLKIQSEMLHVPGLWQRLYLSGAEDNLLFLSQGDGSWGWPETCFNTAWEVESQACL